MTEDWANDVQEEIINVLVAAGIVPAVNTRTQLRDAIRRIVGQNALIFPEILTANAAFAFTATAGQIVVADAQNFIHRGATPYSTAAIAAVDRTFATAASRTYHLVWDAPGTGNAVPAASWPSGRFTMVDLTGASRSRPTPATTARTTGCCARASSPTRRTR